MTKSVLLFFTLLQNVAHERGNKQKEEIFAEQMGLKKNNQVIGLIKLFLAFFLLDFN